MKRVVVCGARDFANPEPVAQVIAKLLQIAKRADDLLIITGGQDGVDTLARRVAQARGIHVAEVDALWDAYGRSAGPRRNGVMLSLQPRLVVAIHYKPRLGTGTYRCVQQATGAGIKVRKIIVPEHRALQPADDLAMPFKHEPVAGVSPIM